jgi:hypothetical protein
MDEKNTYDQVKHLEFIQNAVVRMAQNSFACKSWAITLFSVVMLAENTVLEAFLKYSPIVMIVIIFAFWYLDSYYLRLERLFRKLYDDVRKSDYRQDPYSMNFTPFTSMVQSKWEIMFSVSESLIYLPLCTIIFLRGCV